MKYYLAPMEGITGYIYRNAYHQTFEAMDKYFTPFLTPNQNRSLRSKELSDVLPEHNKGLTIIPQILTNKADDFIWMCQKLEQLGYSEVNLNLGCPSKTVVTKGKGSGFLGKSEQLEAFLIEIFKRTSLKISIKTRLGLEDPEEFEKLLRIYNWFPLAELIVHPRTQQELYKGNPHLEIVPDLIKKSKSSICYNGDIKTVEKYNCFCQQFDQIQCIMMGRGIISNPFLLEMIKDNTVTIDKKRLKKFHDLILEGYQSVLFGDRNILFKMKELWVYLQTLFEEDQKKIKKIKKAQSVIEYQSYVEELLHTI